MHLLAALYLLWTHDDSVPGQQVQEETLTFTSHPGKATRMRTAARRRLTPTRVAVSCLEDGRWQVLVRTHRRRPLCTVGGNRNRCSHCAKQHGGSSKILQIKLPCGPATPLLCQCLEEPESGSGRDTVFTTAPLRAQSHANGLGAQRGQRAKELRVCPRTDLAVCDTMGRSRGHATE